MPTLEAGYTYAVVPYLPPSGLLANEEESIYGTDCLEFRISCCDTGNWQDGESIGTFVDVSDVLGAAAYVTQSSTGYFFYAVVALDEFNPVGNQEVGRLVKANSIFFKSTGCAGEEVLMGGPADQFLSGRYIPVGLIGIGDTESIFLADGLVVASPDDLSEIPNYYVPKGSQVVETEVASRRLTLDFLDVQISILLLAALVSSICCQMIPLSPGYRTYLLRHPLTLGP